MASFLAMLISQKKKVENIRDKLNKKKTHGQFNLLKSMHQQTKKKNNEEKNINFLWY